MKPLISLFSVLALSTLGFASLAQASPVVCEDSSGRCEVESTFYSCECSGGMAVAGETASEPRTGDEPEPAAPTEADCQRLLEDNCAAWELVDSCVSEKGACGIFAGGFSSCQCADGMGSSGGESEPGWGGEGEPGNPPDWDDGWEDRGDDSGPVTEPAKRARIMDQALVCDDVLLEACPNDPPNPAEHCDGEALVTCTTIANWFGDCYEQTVWPYMIVECCEELGREDSGLEELWACVQDAGCEDAWQCFGEADAEEAFFGGDRSSGGVDSGDGAPTGGDDADDEGEEEEDNGGCSQTGGPAWLGLLALMALVFRRRLA